jgi:hypothetical protein
VGPEREVDNCETGSYKPPQKKKKIKYKKGSGRKRLGGRHTYQGRESRNVPVTFRQARGLCVIFDVASRAPSPAPLSSLYIFIVALISGLDETR